MIPNSETYFGLKDGGDFVRIEPLQAVKYDSDLNWDRNWINTKVFVKAGAFNGEYVADFMTTDFELFKRAIKELNNNFTGEAKFEPLERQLILQIKGDGLGHFKVNGITEDQPGYGNKLSFCLSFDQTILTSLIDKLDNITKAFPISGDMSIKNE